MLSVLSLQLLRVLEELSFEGVLHVLGCGLKLSIKAVICLFHDFQLFSERPDLGLQVIGHAHLGLESRDFALQAFNQDLLGTQYSARFALLALLLCHFLRLRGVLLLVVVRGWSDWRRH